jgi:ribose transport system ATP-binding protein
MAGSLSIGLLQLLAIARALSMNARIILMDEPTSSLFNDSVERLFRVIAELKHHGVSIVYVSHKMDEIFRICDRVTVLRDGETIGTRAICETSADELIRMMVARELQPKRERGGGHETSSAEVAFSVANLSTDKLHDVSFELSRGEVLGIAGLVGSGRSQLGAALFGLGRRSGAILLNGRPVAPRSPREAIRLGIGLLPEDRKLRGIDVGAKEDIYRIIAKLASSGKAAIFVSSELPELLRCCDRIMVMKQGRVTATYDSAEATQEKIMATAS